MFANKSLTLYSVCSFDATNFAVRCLNQAFVAAITILFLLQKSVYTSMLFIWVLIFNYLNCKIHFRQKNKVQLALATQTDFRFTCRNREKAVFLSFLIISACFMLLRLPIFILNLIKPNDAQRLINERFSSESQEIYSRTTFFIFESDEAFMLDFFCQFTFFLFSMFLFFLNRRIQIYFDFYTVKIYRVFFNDFAKYFTVISMMVLLILKEVIFFQVSFSGLIESVVLLILLIKLFFKFKIGNYRNVSKYINILKYLTIFKLLCFSVLIIINQFFAAELDVKLMTFIASEMHNSNYPGGPRMTLLVALYVCYNYLNFIFKFQNIFAEPNKNAYQSILNERPYRHKFIEFFAANLLTILRVKNLEEDVKKNLELNMKFYKELKNLNNFRRAFLESFKKTSKKLHYIRENTIYEMWRKYKTIIRIYKYDAIFIAANTAMVIYLSINFYKIDIVSILHLFLCLIIMIFKRFKIIWTASIIFCIGPSLFLITIFGLIYFINFMHWTNTEWKIISFMGNFGFFDVDNISVITRRDLSEAIKHQFLLLVVCVMYNLVLLYAEKRKGLGVKRRWTQVLKRARVSILDTDKDFLYLFRSLFKGCLVAIKYALILFVLKESLTHINLTNAAILVVIFFYLIYPKDVVFDCLKNTLLIAFIMKFCSRYKVIFGIFEDHYNLILGFYFNSPMELGFDNIKPILSSQKTQFYTNFFVVYTFFIVDSLLERANDIQISKTPGFKTKFLNVGFQFLVGFYQRSRDIIDSMKIFCAYFSIFFLSVIQKPDRWTIAEYMFISGVLVFHMLLFKKQKNVKHNGLLLIFLLYLSYILILFINEYIYRFSSYRTVWSIKGRVLSDRLNLMHPRQNFIAFFPFVIKTVLTVISIKSVHEALYSKETPLILGQANQDTAKLSKDDNELSIIRRKSLYEKLTGNKMSHKLIKIASVFLKEILLFYTVFYFLQPANIFKVFYIGGYAYYFRAQTRALTKVFYTFRLGQLLQAKIYYYKYYLLIPHSDPPAVKLKNENFSVDALGALYYRLFSRTVFNKIHQKVNTTWIWMFGVVMSYMQAVLLLNLWVPAETDEAKSLEFKNNRIILVLFNFKDYKAATLTSESLKILFVLGLTLFEIYFIDLLKTEKKPDQKYLTSTIADSLITYYKSFVNESHFTISNKETQWTDHHRPVKRGDHKSLADDIYATEIKTTYRINILTKPREPIESNGVDTLTRSLTSEQRTLLIVHNRSKQSFLQCFMGYYMGFKRILILPLLLGLLYAKSSPFLLASPAIFFLFYTEKKYFTSLYATNTSLALLCVSEYFCVFIINAFQLIDPESVKDDSNFFIRTVYSFVENPLMGLPYIFLYTTLIKAFFLSCILLCREAFVEVDKVSQSIFRLTKHFNLLDSFYTIVDYKVWGRDSYFFYYRLKKNILGFLADAFFILSLITYYQTTGVITVIPMVLLLSFKLGLAFFWKIPFAKSMSQRFRTYYVILSYLNFVTLICSLLPTNVWIIGTRIHARPLFAIGTILNLLLLDCIDSDEAMSEKSVAESHFQLRNLLAVLSMVRSKNERNIVESVRGELINEYLRAYASKEEAVGFHKNLVRGLHDFSQESLTSLSIFADTRKYRKYLLTKLNSHTAIFVKASIWLKNKLLATNAVSGNLLSLVENHLHNNAPFLEQGYSLDLLKMVRGDVSDVQHLMDEIKARRDRLENQSGKTFVTTIQEKFGHETLVSMERQRTQTLGMQSPSTPLICREVVKKANNFLQAELTRDWTAQKFLSTKPNNFGENFFKHRIGNNSFLIVRNFDEISAQLFDLKFTNFSLRDYIRWIGFLFWLQFETLLNVCFILLFSVQQGFISSIYTGMLMFFILIESRIKNLRLWKIFYLVFLINFLVEVLVSTHYDLSFFYKDPVSKPNPTYPYDFVAKMIIFFYGHINQKWLLLIFVLLETILMHLFDNVGWDRTFAEIESPAQALFRVSLNPTSWRRIYARFHAMLLSEINFLEQQVKNRFRKKLAPRQYTVFLVKLIKAKSQIFKAYREKFGVFMYYLLKIVPNYKQDFERVRPENFASYFWRNFSHPLRRSGKDFHGRLLLILGATNAYFLVFFFQIQGVNKNLLEIITKNEIKGALVVNFSLLLLCVCVERYLYSKSNLYWIECTSNEKDIVQKRVRYLNVDLNKLTLVRNSPKDSLRLAVHKLILIMRWKRPLRPDLKRGFMHNPLLLRFYFTVIFWVYMVALVFFVTPMTSNTHISGGTLNRIFCNSSYRTQKNMNIPEAACNCFATNIYLRVLFLMANLYVVVAIIQIRKGFSSSLYFKPIEFGKMQESIKFYAYKYTPYIRELKTVIDYAAARTSLNVFQWLKLEDIQTTINTAKMNEVGGRDGHTQIKKFTRRAVGLIFLLFFFVLLIAPLYLFSDIVPNNVIDELTSATLFVKVQVDAGTQVLFHNIRFDIDRLSKYPKLYERARKSAHLKNVDPDLLRKLSFDTDSETYLDITTETVKQIKQDFMRKKELRIIVEAQMQSRYKNKIKVLFPFRLDEETSLAFLGMISANSCSRLARHSITLGHVTKFIDLKTLSQDTPNVVTEIVHGLEGVFVLAFNCDQSHKFHFSLSDKNAENIEFVVLSENIKSSVDMLKKFTSSNVSVLSIYILIFSYIGLTLVRKAFFDQTHVIWTTEMPNAHKLEEHLYMILYSRLRGDLYAEELFFNKLIDLFRAPEKIKKLTGPLVHSKKMEMRKSEAI